MFLSIILIFIGVILLLERLDIINNGFGVVASKVSSAVVVDNFIEGNTGPGIFVGLQYGFLALLGQNTVENNVPDVQCDPRGVLESPAPQNSITKTTSISPDCAVLGTIF